MNIRERLNKEKEYMVELRRYFHQNPEPSLKEYNTASRIEHELDKLNISHQRVGETGVIGYIGENNIGKIIALRATKILKELEGELNGTVKLLFQ